MSTSRRSTVSDAGQLEAESHVIPASWLSRRRFLGGVGSAVGVAAIEACNKAPPEQIIPYVDRPPEVVPGVATYYASSTTRRGYGVGLLVESHTGRPTKIEGHPEHPASLGGTLAQEQAEVLTLYDPDRAQGILKAHASRPWRNFVEVFGGGSTKRGKELLLLEPTGSPLTRELLEALHERRPNMSIYFDPTRAPTARWNAAKRVLGEVLEPQYRFDKAELVLALDADFLTSMPMSIRWARDFAGTRDTSRPEADLSRLYVVECALTPTGARADHRLAARSSELGRLTAGLLHAALALDPEGPDDATRLKAQKLWRSLAEEQQEWLTALAKDLQRKRGRCVILAGDHQPSAVHALVLALNELLGNVGKTVSYARSPLLEAGEPAYSLDGFFDALDSGEVEAAFVLGGNPSYLLPPELRFEERFAKAKERVYLSLYANETARRASWLLGAAHFLEAWGATRAYDGTLSLQQPLIRPLYGGKSADEVLSVLGAAPHLQGRELVRRHFLDTFGDEETWAEALARGVVADSAFPARSPELDFGAVAEALDQVTRNAVKSGLELQILPDPRVEDGRLSNNPWLLELPEPVTKLVWDNAALLAPATAERLSLGTGDVIEIDKGGRSIEVPVLVAPEQAEDAVVIWLGWGRQGAESVARGVGVDVVPLREARDPWLTRDIQVRATGRHQRLVTTQDETSMHGREIALVKSQREWKQEPDFAEHLDEAPLSILPDRSRKPPQWGMTIDLSRCTGCSSCVIACQAENNVPSVGKEMVGMGREMHWIRIDVYRDGPDHRPRTLFQPMLCQHCEDAPCEYVCPVNATVHSDDGLNEMVYNRCVGTRFCSNNCPYKVRRFNFYDYNQDPPEVKKLVYNPDVTVRARGVMEKCSYCVQRIRRAQIDAKLADRPLRDGDVRTACQQVCPAQAIAFGEVSDPRSAVSERYRNPRTFQVLNELGTRPRTRYLARIDNPNKELSS